MPRFEAPVGPQNERNAGIIWPSEWIDVNPYGSLYDVKPDKPAIHTGADLNLKRGVDNNAPVYAMGDGTVSYAGFFSESAWGNIIVIYHGRVDDKVLYSRYGHVQGIEPSVKKLATVTKGQLIARVGNGGPGLNFDPHLHFDISTTSIMEETEKGPGFWPGNHEDLVKKYFVDPYAWLKTHIQQEAASKPTPIATPLDEGTTQLRFVIHPEGVQVRRNHKLSEAVVSQLQLGTKLSILKSSGFKEDELIWAQISGGDFDGCWVPACTVNEHARVFYLATQVPK